MANSHTHDKSDAMKVTEQYLKDFARTKIKAFLDDLAANPAFQALLEFDRGTGGGQRPGDYSKLMTGGGKLVSGPALQAQFKAFATSLLHQLQAVQDTMTKTSTDLEMVDAVLVKAGDQNDITATEMMQDLHDVLQGLGTSGPSNPPA